MIYRIESVKETKEGFSVTVSFPVSAAVKKRRFTVSRECYEENGAPRENTEIGSDLYDALVSECDAKDALLHAYSLVDYADCSTAALYKKLRLRGYLKESARKAIQILTEKGVLSDTRLLSHAIPVFAETKLCGKRKIIETFTQKGFRHSDICDAIAKCVDSGEIDFEAIRRAYIEKKHLLSLPAEERIAVLKKQGF